MTLDPDGTVYLLKLPGGSADHEFVSRASFDALKSELAQLASAAAVERGAIFMGDGHWRYKFHDRAALEAFLASEGRKVVPVEPTRAMLDAWHDTALGVFRNHPSTRPGIHWSDSEARYVACYKAMLAVAGGA